MIKKRLFLYILIFGLFFIPKSVFAQSYTGRASVGRSAVLDTSSTYYYTDWKLLSDNSLNSVAIPYSGGNYYVMGSEYSFPITLTGDTYFQGTVKVPVVSNTIYNYTLMNGLNENDLAFGVHQNWGVYNNVILIDYNMTWECQTYAHLGVAHNYCFYVINFKFQLPDAWTGAYNLNFKVLNTTGQRSTYYYDGYDSNGCAIEFPVASQNSGYPTLTPSVSMNSTGGSIGGDVDRTDEVLDSISDSTTAITDEIRQSYEDLVKSQEVCNNYTFTINSSSTGLQSCYLQSNGNCSTDVNYYSSDYIPITSNSTATISFNSNYGRVCYYNSSKTVISCQIYGSSNVSSPLSLTIPDNSSYLRFTGQKTLTTTFNSNFCQNGNQAVFDSMNGLHSSILDETITNFIGDNELGTIGGQMTTDTPITDLLAMPITLLNAIITGMNGTCSSFNLGTLWGVGLTIPCIDPELYIGSTLWGIIDILICGFMIYNIAQLMIHDWESITSADDLFEETYTPRHEKMRRS